MMVAMSGIIRGNRVVVDEDISEYNGTNVIVTVLSQKNELEKEDINLSRFHFQTERGKNEDEYMNEMRESVNWDDYSTPSDRPAFLTEYMREMRNNDRI